MHLWQWIVLFFFYLVLSVVFGELLGIDPWYVFWGIPIIIVVITLILTLKEFFGGNQAEDDASIYRKEDKALKKKNKLLLDSILEHSGTVEERLNILLQVVLSTNQSFDYFPLHNYRALEELYLALRYSANKDRLKHIIERNVLSWVKVPDMPDEKKEKIAAKLAQSIEFDQYRNQIDEIFIPHLRNILENGEKEFPSEIKYLNVAAIPVGSYLEEGIYEESLVLLDRKILDEEFTISELREAISKILTKSGTIQFQRYLENSQGKAFGKAKKKINKILEKEKITASDVKNAKRYCSLFCFSSNISDIEYAENTAKRVLELASKQKSTKQMLKACKSLENFIDLPKGYEVEALGEQNVAQIQLDIDELTLLARDENSFSELNFYHRLLNASENALNSPPKPDSINQLETLRELLRIARLHVTALIDENSMTEISNEMVEKIRSINERVSRG